MLNFNQFQALQDLYWSEGTVLEEFDSKSWSALLEADYQSKTVELDKPFRSNDNDHKFYVYVRNEKDNVIKLGFGDPNMEIKRDDPERRKNFRARHQCDVDPGPKWKARYWSCRFWSGKSVNDLI